MEEKIEKILLSHIEAVTEKNSPFAPTAINGVPQSAKEIASHFREFIEWVIIHIDATRPQLDYFTKEMNDIDRKETLENMYNYWLKEVKK